MGIDRRAVMRRHSSTTGGVAAGAARRGPLPKVFGWDRPPLAGGYAAPPTPRPSWHARSGGPLLRGDDRAGGGVHLRRRARRRTGRPWCSTPSTAAGVPATFFMVGREPAKPTPAWSATGWPATRSATTPGRTTIWPPWTCAGVQQRAVPHPRRDQRSPAATPTLLRPAVRPPRRLDRAGRGQMGYDIVLWSHLMRELYFGNDPAGRSATSSTGPARVDRAWPTTPGSRTGLVSLRGLGACSTACRPGLPLRDRLRAGRPGDEEERGAA